MESIILYPKALTVINDHYTPSQAYRIVSLTSYLGQGNMLYVDDYPLDIRELMEAFGYNRNTYYVFIRKLIFHNIIALHPVIVRRHIIYNVILNPSIARKIKTVNTSIPFKDISKGLDPVDLKTLPKFPTN